MLVSLSGKKVSWSVFTATQQPIEYGYDATPFFNTTGHACIAPQTLPCPNHWASRLNGTVAQRRVGTGIVLGDTLNYSTRAIYTQAHSSGWNTAQSLTNMVTSLVSAFVGPAATPFDGKAHLLTNGQTIINTTAFQSAIQHQQQNTPSNNTPRAYSPCLPIGDVGEAPIIAMYTDSALIRISRGANTVHTYSGQRTAQQNGYVYVYTTNEIVRFAHTNESNKQANGQSGIDVWFDDLMVSHRTGPLLQEAHFYPFGQEISPLSSKALLKTPNDRMLQQNEWDEEFGMNLHDFDARMYDASIGRFWGVDVLAHKYPGLSPYNYAANSPYMFADPDGREVVSIGLALLKVGKAIFKGVKTAKAAKAAKVSTKAYKATQAAAKAKEATKFGKLAKAWFRPVAAGTRNVYANRNTINGNFLKGALHFGVAFGGAKFAMMGLDAEMMDVGFGTELYMEIFGALGGGLGNMSVDLVYGTLGDDPLMSFARGASSVISSKFDEKGFKKGYEGIKEFDWGKFTNSALLSGAGAVANAYGTYGQKYVESYGSAIYWQIALGGLLAGGASGGLDGLHYLGIRGNEESFLNSISMNFLNVAVNSFGKDMGKSSVYHGLNSKYNEKNKYWKNLLTTRGSGLNLGMGIGAFFIGLIR